MSREAEIYALVFRRLVMVDHSWGASSPFQEVYVLDSAALNLEQLHTDSGMSARGQPFDDAVKSTLQASAPDLAPVTFVSTFRDIYEPSRPSPSQARNGGRRVLWWPSVGALDERSPGAGRRCVADRQQ